MNESQLLNLLHSADAKTRKIAADLMTEETKKSLQLNTTIYNMLMVDKMQEDKIRGVEYPELGQHLQNMVSKKTIDVLGETIIKNFNLVERYYNFKRSILKLKKVHYYDRYAPIVFSKQKVRERKYSYDSAVEMVRKSFEEFDPEFSNIFMNLVETGRVDVYPKPNKRGGAFCNMAPTPYSPSILLNFGGTPSDVRTLAHEMGHAIHNVSSHSQPYVVSIPGLAMCETASVFGEMIAFQYLLAQAKTREEKIILLSQKIEEAFSTVFRQMSMFFFEQKAHQHIKEKGEVSGELLNSFWLETQRQMYGKSVDLPEDYATWWSYIPHFMHTPFLRLFIRIRMSFDACAVR